MVETAPGERRMHEGYEKGLENKISRYEGIPFQRFYTTRGENPLDKVKYVKRKSYIPPRKESSEEAFQMDDVEVPDSWSQLATDIIASKYFRKAGVPGTGHELSAKQVVERIVGQIWEWGEQQGYFASSEDAENFRDELSFLLINQYGAFNSPVWFNVGLSSAYGIRGNPSGNWIYEHKSGEVIPAEDSYSRPQGSACFIQRIEDNLESITELVKREARLFKYGSGTGTNFSRLRARGETLSGGGTSSGLLSWLSPLDANAGATKSGGTTRRAAKMVILNYDHPEIRDFINWKRNGERIVKILKANGYSSDFENEAYRSIGGQNSNNSVRVTDEFMEGIFDGSTFNTTERTTGNVRETIKNSELMNLIAEAAWESADPGMQFHTTINKWHTCKNTDEIYASNPCSEFMFLDDTACNLASLNTVKFLEKKNGETLHFNVEGFKHAARTFITAQEILVSLSSYPTKDIARNSEDYRPLGLGYANVGALSMIMGLPYDSDGARTLVGALTAIMTGEAYAQSARIAGTSIGPFNGFEKNKKPFMEVMHMHRDSVENIKPIKGLEYLIAEARDIWEEVIELGERNGYRNAQATVLAPTGTIGLLMDCDTTGIEPDYALKKHKKLAGGGNMTIVNQSVPIALKNLGYNKQQINEISAYITGNGTEHIDEAPHIKTKHISALTESKDIVKTLKELNYSQDEIRDIRGFVEGHNSVEGAPYIKEEYYPIFDTANKSEFGTRYISPMGHVKMMAAAQPFISGAISKTVNLPEEASVDDIKKIYIESWKHNLKAVALYRDNSKLSQPLNVSEHGKEGTLEKELIWGERKRVERKRRGITEKLTVGGSNIILRTGEYPDGSLGEIFLDAFKGGTEWKTALGVVAFIASKAIQYGMPPEELVEDLMHVQAEPRGVVQGYAGINVATSIFDAVGKVLGLEYFGNMNLANDPEKIDLKNLRYIENKRIKMGLELLEQLEKNGKVNLSEIRDTSKNTSKTRDDNGKGEMITGPACSCGGMTIKTGSCYTCLSCGSNEGCG